MEQYYLIRLELLWTHFWHKCQIYLKFWLKNAKSGNTGSFLQAGTVTSADCQKIVICEKIRVKSLKWAWKPRIEVRFSWSSCDIESFFLSNSNSVSKRRRRNRLKRRYVSIRYRKVPLIFYVKSIYVVYYTMNLDCLKNRYLEDFVGSQADLQKCFVKSIFLEVNQDW